MNDTFVASSMYWSLPFHPLRFTLKPRFRYLTASSNPKVVHIDQESDFKITTLAENFEDFIRGLENAEKYDIIDKSRR